MQYTVTAPERINAEIDLPASKSISNRALIINALSGGKTIPTNLSDCDDTEVIVRALADMPHDIDIMAAGTAMRFLTAYLATREGEEHLITGTERMKHRPIKVLVDALRYLGAEIEYAGEEGFPPLKITGHTLEGGRLEIPGNVSSQFISALLMIGPVLTKGLELVLTGNIMSRPYIDLTLHTMHDYGAKAEWSDIRTIRVAPNGYKEREYHIENDWSAASYWYEMLVLMKDKTSEIRLNGLMDASRQGDSAVRYLFSMLGVKSRFGTTEQGVPTTVTLKKTEFRVPRMEYDFKNQPDLAPTLVVTCCLLGVPFHFVGLSTLKIKETDRIEALKREMRKLGYILTDHNDSELTWNGDLCEPDEQPAIDTYEDHRMALAFAPASIVFPGLIINEPRVVTKSYPEFWEHLKAAGFLILNA